MNPLVSIVRCSPLFRHKSLDEIAVILDELHYTQHTFLMNEVVFTPAHRGNQIGIILSGEVDIEKVFPSGKVVLIERKKNFDLVNESAIFSQYEYCPELIVSTRQTSILFISKEALQNLLITDKTIMLNFIEYMSDTTLMLRYKIGILSLNAIQQKIAGYLLHDYKIHASLKIVLPFSKKSWAEYLDVSRTSLSRELKTLESQGVISVDKTTICITNLEKLEELLCLV